MIRDIKRLWNHLRHDRRVVISDGLADCDYELTILELKLVGAKLENFLARGRAAAHKNMREISPGCWIHNDYKDLHECLKELISWLPKSANYS